MNENAPPIHIWRQIIENYLFYDRKVLGYLDVVEVLVYQRGIGLQSLLDMKDIT